jgi:DNA-directed RNA polymerase alpha subunit
MEETGKELGLTRERVRQMEHAALKKMKHYNKLPALFGFFELPDDPNSIEHLKLSVRTRECLRRYAGITTITGIKDFDGDWLKIRNLGRRGVSEIEEKMTLAGYPDFKILL